MADYGAERLLERKTKLFYIDFTPLIVYAHTNLVHIFNGKNLQMITVLHIILL